MSVSPDEIDYEKLLAEVPREKPTFVTSTQYWLGRLREAYPDKTSTEDKAKLLRYAVDINTLFGQLVQMGEAMPITFNEIRSWFTVSEPFAKDPRAWKMFLGLQVVSDDSFVLPPLNLICMIAERNLAKERDRTVRIYEMLTRWIDLFLSVVVDLNALAPFLGCPPLFSPLDFYDHINDIAAIALALNMVINAKKDKPQASLVTDYTFNFLRVFYDKFQETSTSAYLNILFAHIDRSALFVSEEGGGVCESEILEPKRTT